MKKFEVCFYKNGCTDPVRRITCTGVEEAQVQIEKYLRDRKDGIYTATSWPLDQNGPDGFRCHYINSKDEIFNSTLPIILSPEHAAKLQRRSMPPTPVTVELTAKDRRRRGERRTGQRRK